MESEIGKKPSLIKRLMITGQLTRFTIYITAAIPTIIFVILALFSFSGTINPIEYSNPMTGAIGQFGTGLDFLLLAILIFTGTFGVYEAFRLRRVRKIDDRFPDFVRDLAESRRAGMTFTKAIMYSAKGNYGVLTPEIQKIARQISWGSSVDEALNSFAKRVNTRLIKRTISLIIEASRSGGNVADVLEAASKDAREIRFIDSERRANMLSYVAVIYVGMFVFLVIIIVLTHNFLPSMYVEGSEEASNAPKIELQTLNNLFLYAAIVQSTGMGVVAGVFEEGDIISGVKHIFVMILITWMIFKIFIGV